MLRPVTTMPELGLPPSNLQGEHRCLRAVRCKAVHVATDETTANVLIDKTIDRHARGLRNSLHDFVGHEGLPGAISKKGRVEDDRMWRQLREFFQELLHRRCGQISEGYASIIRLELLPRCVEEFEIDLGTAANHHDIFGRRMEAESELKRRRKFPRQEHAAHPGGRERPSKYVKSTPRKTMAAPGNTGSTEFSRKSSAGCRMASVTSICLSAYFFRR